MRFRTQPPRWLAMIALVMLTGCSPSMQAVKLATTPTILPPDAGGGSVRLPLPAFPGAEGFGAGALGGRGGRVLEVTNLNDSGPGSLRAAVEATGPRIVVFRVAGTIELTTTLQITNPYITIAGQTAPGGGITLKSDPGNTDVLLVVYTHDVIVRYLRVRPGPPAQLSEDSNAITIVGNDVIIDHCSFSWAIDEVASTWYDTHDITIQWSIIAEALYCSTHAEGCHSMGLMLGSEGSHDISVHHNLLAHNHERNPLVTTSGLVDVVNNVIYNPWGTPVIVTDDRSPTNRVRVNCVGNYFKRGADTDESKHLVTASSSGKPGVEIFVEGNITPQRPSDRSAERLAVKPEARQWIVQNQHDAPSVTTTSALEAYDQVLADVGATIGLDSLGNSFWRRDAVDERIVHDVRSGTGRIINDPSEVGGWPELAAGTVPEDSDHDGMPDAWERLQGFRQNDPSDGPADADGDGYTNVEEYLNGTDPVE
jgi:pectate lyase